MSFITSRIRFHVGKLRRTGCQLTTMPESLGVLDKYVGTLRDYQTVGAAFLYRSPRSMLGDAAGLGKTPQICGMINAVRRNATNPDFAGTVYGNTKKILVACGRFGGRTDCG